MISYSLQIVTPDGLLFSGEALAICVRTIGGDVGIRARHADLVSALGMGTAYVDIDAGTRRYAACIGGVLAVMNGQVRIVATTFEWADQIDIVRAQEAKKKAAEMIAAGVSKEEQQIAQARIRRAEVRIGAYEKVQDGISR